MEGERLAADLRLALGRIEPSYNSVRRAWHWPCRVSLRSGGVLERVIFCPLTKDFLESERKLSGMNPPVGLPVADILNL